MFEFYSDIFTQPICSTPCLHLYEYTENKYPD